MSDMRAAIYARKSTAQDGPEEARSVARQEAGDAPGARPGDGR